MTRKRQVCMLIHGPVVPEFVRIGLTVCRGPAVQYNRASRLLGKRMYFSVTSVKCLVPLSVYE